MDQFTQGAIAAGYAVAGAFFLRFWRDTRDRLFALFALAFLALAANRAALVWLTPDDEQARGSPLYWVRFAAFALFLAAVVDKNRAGRRAT